jgi:hypothetical protein
MELLGDMGHVESCIGPLGDGVSVDVSRTVCAKLTMAQKSFCIHPMVLLGDEAQMEAHFKSVLEIVLILRQHRCTVCAERTIASNIILEAPDGTPRRRGSSGSSF